MSRVSLKSRKGPSLFIACELCASLAATETVRIVRGGRGLKPAPYYLQFDPWTRTLRRGVLRGGNRHLLQRLKIFIVSHFLIKDEDRIGHVPPPPPVRGQGEWPSAEALRYILQAGIAAPSGDNAQPWLFSVGTAHVTARINPQVDTSFFNFRQIASLISLGAVVENMSLAASSLDLQAEVSCQGQEAADIEVRLDLHASSGPGDELAEQIWERCTNRQMYKRKPLDPARIQRIEAAAQQAGPCRLRFVTQGPELKTVARAVSLADRIRTEHRGLHEYFTGMVHFDEKTALASDRGLPLKNLYAGKAGEVFLKLTRPWPVMQLANWLGLGRLEAQYSAMGIMRSSGVCLLSIPGGTARDFVAGGRALQRAWLRLTQLGLALQPMTAVTLFLLRLQLEGESSFSPAHCRLLRESQKLLDQAFGDLDLDDWSPVMLFRMGLARPLRYGTFRQPVEAFLRD